MAFRTFKTVSDVCFFMKTIINPSIVDGRIVYEVSLPALSGIYEELRAELLVSSSPQRKEQLEKLFNFLEKKTDYLTAPASTKYHLCCKHGLRAHCVGVALVMDSLRSTLAPSIPSHSAVLVGLVHDVGKVGSVGSRHYPRYLPNILKKGEQSTAQPYKYSEDLIEMPVAMQSLCMVSRFVGLQEAESQAILAHDGQYISENKSFAHNETPLTLIAHYSDYWVSRIVEQLIPEDMGFRGAIDE